MAKGGIENLKAFKRKLDKRLEKNAVKRLENFITVSTLDVRGTILESLQRGGTGTTYQKYNPRRQHTASSPGEPPVTDTGQLASSISTTVKRRGTAIVGQIIAAAPYAADLEFGTKAMKKKGGGRPFMQPALEKNRPKIRRLFKRGGYLD
tara:strand:- start:458 stop:907 length:450 start_codon:yes stop_codon:yes gene_type:complete